jgi:AraC-like DNA-binding protein
VQLSFAAPHAKMLPFTTVYYMFEEDQPLIDDGQRADCGHLRIFLDGSGYQRMPDGKRIESSSFMLMGPHSTASRFVVRGPLRFVGLSLRARAWGGLFDCDASSLLNSGCDGAPLLAPDAMHLIDQLRPCTTIEEMVPMLDAFFLARAKSIPDQHARVNDAIAAWLKAAYFPDVETLFEACALSPRQVTRIANIYWGAPPKALASKYGALRTASLIMEGVGAIPEAAKAHYADASHMIREVKRVTGMTPRQLHTISNAILRFTLHESNFRELEPVT